MKKFLSIYGTVLFLFVTYLFLDDLPNGSFLFKRYKPFFIMDLYKFPLKYDLSPFLMFYIYMIVLVSMILTIRFKETHIIATIGNLIISIPIFMVHKDTLFFEPFYFMYSYSRCIYIIRWVWYIYFSIFGGVMFAAYLFFNSNKRTERQRKAIKKVIKIGLISIAVFVVIYIAQCFYLSFKTNYLVDLAYDTNGKYSQDLEDVISENLFERLNHREGWRKGIGVITEENNITFPFTLCLGDKACSTYRYTYKKIDSIQGAIGNAYKIPIKVKWELRDLKWIVTDVYEHP